jgi:hypothetical protein
MVLIGREPRSAVFAGLAFFVALLITRGSEPPACRAAVAGLWLVSTCSVVIKKRGRGQMFRSAGTFWTLADRRRLKQNAQN